MIQTWDEMRFWQSGEWDVIQQHLDDHDNAGILFNPRRELLFASMDATPFASVKVALIGQDPYPDRQYCTGMAFSIPKNCRTIPASLDIILEEYANDLHYPKPTSGSLHKWAERGVFLWNAVPSCRTGESNSHNFPEWRLLSEEVVQSLSSRRVVLVFLGKAAQGLAQSIAPDAPCKVLYTAHPAAERYGRNDRLKNKFSGSRIFTTINSELRSLRQTPIDWKLT